MPIIDNKSQTMQSALANALTPADRVDISVGYFYFSGFEALADQLKDEYVLKVLKRPFLRLKSIS